MKQSRADPSRMTTWSCVRRSRAVVLYRKSGRSYSRHTDIYTRPRHDALPSSQIGEQARLAIYEAVARRPLAHADRLMRAQVACDDIAVVRTHDGRGRKGVGLACKGKADPPVGRIAAQELA